MASAQQPRLWHGRGQIPAGKDWKENPPEPGTLLERDPQGDAVHLGVARLQSPAAPSPGPRTHGRQSPETQQAMSSEEAWGHWKMAWKTLPRSLPGCALSLLGSRHAGARDAGPRRPGAWLGSLFPSWARRAESSGTIRLRAQETSDLTGSRPCFAAQNSTVSICQCQGAPAQV